MQNARASRRRGSGGHPDVRLGAKMAKLRLIRVRQASVFDHRPLARSTQSCLPLCRVLRTVEDCIHNNPLGGEFEEDGIGEFSQLRTAIFIHNDLEHRGSLTNRFKDSSNWRRQ